MHPPTLLSISNDLFLHSLFPFFTPQGLCRVGVCNKRLATLTNEPRLWKQLFEKKFPDYLAEVFKQNLHLNDSGIYKRLYWQAGKASGLTPPFPRFERASKYLNELFEADVYGCHDLINLIVRSIENPETRKEYFFCAAAWGTGKVVKAFLELGIPVNSVDDRQMTALHLNAMNGRGGSVVPLLVKEGADPNLRDQYSWAPLHWAGRNGNKQVAKDLIKANAKQDILDNQERTPLDLARQVHTSNEATRKFLENPLPEIREDELKEMRKRSPQGLLSRIIQFIKAFFEKIKKHIKHVIDSIQTLSKRVFAPLRLSI